MTAGVNGTGAQTQGVIDVNVADLAEYVATQLDNGWRFAHLTAYLERPGSWALATLIIDPREARTQICTSRLSGTSFQSITGRVPQAHWCERAVHDLFGIRALGHPRSKSLLLHDAWPEGFYPLHESGRSVDLNEPARSKSYSFQFVKGEGVYEIPVGPIHAGIIEPGHFRFSCLGEVIQNLEIRLGYQHRGVEEQLTRLEWKKGRFLAEAASSDTTVGNALAHALAIEQLIGLDAPDAAVTLRGVALEIERVSSHIGDLGGICSDIGYAGGASIFGRIRGRALGLGERLTGSRFQTAYVLPGGVVRGLSEELRVAILDETHAITAQFENASVLLTDNTNALERMEGVGAVKPSVARDFGLVGPSGRACGIHYDVRHSMRQSPFNRLNWKVALESTGDVLARVLIRVEETRTSLALIRQLLNEPIRGALKHDSLPDTLLPRRFGVGIVESWRGELIHLVITDDAGAIVRYTIKDPSFNNWTGLSVAARGQLVSDFPLCNKSFGLSYSGNDL